MATAAHPLADEFTRIFREEHRTVRDTLLELLRAFQDRDAPRLRTLLSGAAAYVGPHFRYEEECLYPVLTEFLGEEHIEHLLADHDSAIGAAAQLVVLAGKDSLGDADVAEARKLIREILPHVSDCDGLSLLVEVLEDEKVKSILDARDRSLQAGLDLFRWANEVRERRIVTPAPPPGGPSSQDDSSS